MARTKPGEVTQLLLEYQAGDREAIERLLPLVYQELKRLAAAYMKREASHHTLQPTALVHEAFLRLVDQKEVQWQNKAHFMGVAAKMMRRLLTDHARAKHAAKRGGAQVASPFEEALYVSAPEIADFGALDEALTKLEVVEPHQAKVVEFRFYGGMSIEETAEVMSISPASVKRYWTLAKVWLKRELSESGDG